jgi:hypothetical protein
MNEVVMLPACSGCQRVGCEILCLCGSAIITGPAARGAFQSLKEKKDGTRSQ